MAWNPTHAAFRYFRRSGSIIDKNARIIILPRHNIMSTRGKKHKEVLESQTYLFTVSLFSEQECPGRKFYRTWCGKTGLITGLCMKNRKKPKLCDGNCKRMRDYDKQKSNTNKV